MYQEEVMVPAAESTIKRGKNLGENDKISQASGTKSGIIRKMENCVGRDMVYPSNVLHLSSEAGNKGHSAAFPRALPEWFIRLFTVEGDLVLDPFCGSGTTIEVARDLGRQGVGIELNEEYYELAKERCK